MKEEPEDWNRTKTVDERLLLYKSKVKTIFDLASKAIFAIVLLGITLGRVENNL